MGMVGLEKLRKWDWVKLSVPWNVKLASNNQAKYEFELSNMSVKGFTVQKIARMKNGINRYKKVRIDLGWKPKECLQSYKEFCQSLLCFSHTCTYISYTKNVSWLAKFFMWLATFFKFHPRYNNVLLPRDLKRPSFISWEHPSEGTQQGTHRTGKESLHTEGRKARQETISSSQKPNQHLTNSKTKK